MKIPCITLTSPCPTRDGQRVIHSLFSVLLQTASLLHSDYSWKCTVGEEQGFIGSAAVLLAFLILILRLIALSERQTSTFGRVYGYSVVSIFLFHLFINVGMVLGLTPVIGIPLPFFSYGGSSLWGFTILLFIFLRLDAGRGRRL